MTKTRGTRMIRWGFQVYGQDAKAITAGTDPVSKKISVTIQSPSMTNSLWLDVQSARALRNALNQAIKESMFPDGELQLPWPSTKAQGGGGSAVVPVKRRAAKSKTAKPRVVSAKPPPPKT